MTENVSFCQLSHASYGNISVTEIIIDKMLLNPRKDNAELLMEAKY